MDILIVSPIPMSPLNHGNRARQVALITALKKLGHRVTYVYGAREAITVEDEEAMRDIVDHLYVYEPVEPIWKTLRPPPHHLDDWWLPGLQTLLISILATRSYGAAIASYVWFSKFLDYLPDTIIKCIDTHDIFANRQEDLAKMGITSDFFSTTVEEENKGLARADHVLAIQAEEADTFKARSVNGVRIVGHIVPDQRLAKDQPSDDAPVKIGLFASNNPLNQHAVKQLTKAINTYKGKTQIDWYLVGTIVNTAAGQEWPGQKVAWVNGSEDFYTMVDIAINPHEGGTGLKIKSVEAQSYGLPLIATKDAMVGLPATHPLHRLPTAESVVHAAYDLVKDRGAITDLANASLRDFYDYQKAQIANLSEVFPQ